MYHVMKFQAPFERIKEYNSSEVSLYKAIITQAIVDATNTSDSYLAKSLEKDAKRWLFGSSSYFREICCRAEIEPSFVVKIAKDAIKLNQERNIRNKNETLVKNMQKNLELKKELKYAGKR